MSEKHHTVFITPPCYGLSVGYPARCIVTRNKIDCTPDNYGNSVIRKVEQILKFEVFKLFCSEGGTFFGKVLICSVYYYGSIAAVSRGGSRLPYKSLAEIRPVGSSGYCETALKIVLSSPRFTGSVFRTEVLSETVTRQTAFLPL